MTYRTKARRPYEAPTLTHLRTFIMVSPLGAAPSGYQILAELANDEREMRIEKRRERTRSIVEKVAVAIVIAVGAWLAQRAAP